MATEQLRGRPQRRLVWGGGETSSAETSIPAQMAKIYDFLKGMHAAHLIDVGVHLGLFESLINEGGSAQPERLASVTGLHLEYVAIWCETASALELLERKNDGAFCFAPHMDVILGDPSSTFYVGKFPEAHFQIARDYARYPELFRTGGVVPYQEHDAAFFTAVAAATRVLPRMFADLVLPKLPSVAEQLQAGAALLDVGCGGGYAIVEFATRYPSIRCTGVDVEPTSIALARALIRERGLEARVDVRLLDATDFPADLFGCFDLVTQFLVLHEVEPDMKMTVLEHCAAALKPGGHLLIFDEAYPEDATELRHPLKIFSVMAQWYESTWGNTINTRTEIREMLSAAGLLPVEETELSRFYIVVARKP